MKSIGKFWTGVVLTILCVMPGSARAELLGITFNDELISIDESTGAGSLIGTLSSQMYAFGLADWDGRLFTFDQMNDVIAELDPATGATIETFDVGLAGLGGEGSIALDSSGMGFLTEDKVPVPMLYSFDLDALSSTTVGGLPENMDGLDFDDSDTLFALNGAGEADTLKLYQIDPNSASGTVIGDTGVTGARFNKAGLTFDDNGTLFAVMNDTLFELDPATGAVIAEIGAVGFANISGLTAIRTASGPETVALDIAPGSCRNPLNSRRRGVLRAAILGTDNFDVATIDRSSVRLEGIAPVRSWRRDLSSPVFEPQEPCECPREGRDGYEDLGLKFDAHSVIRALGDVSNGDILILTLTATLLDGTEIQGEDCVLIQKKGNRRPLPEPQVNPGGWNSRTQRPGAFNWNK
jgi:hypothetical protein